MKITVKNQGLIITENETLVAGSVLEHTVEFTFSDGWEGYTKTAVFKTQGGIIKDVLLSSAGAAVIPWEVLAGPQYIQIGVYGVMGEFAKPTLWTAPQYVNPGAEPYDRATYPASTPWADALEAVEDAKTEAVSAAEDAEAYAVGKRGGETVESTDPTYHNNAKYYSEQASGSATAASTAKTAAQEAAATASAAYGTDLLAPNYGDLTPPILVGQHCIHSGDYYECISPITEAEEWTAAHWKQVTVGGETSDLKSAIDDITMPGLTWEEEDGYCINYYGNKAENAGTKIIWLKLPSIPWKYISIPGTNATVLTSGVARKCNTRYADASKNLISGSAPYRTDGNVLDPTTDIQFITNTGDLPANAVYAAFCYTSETVFAPIKVFSPYAYWLKNNELTLDIEYSVREKYMEIGRNLVGEEFQYVENSLVATKTSETGMSNFFPVSDGMTLYYEAASYCQLALFNEDLTWLVNVSMSGNKAKNTLDLTSYPTAVWGVVTGSASASGRAFDKTKWVSTRNLNYRRNKSSLKLLDRLISPNVYRDELITRLNGKTFAVIGDSISATGSGHMYIDYLKNRLMMTEGASSAIGGTWVSGTANNAFTSDARINALDANADYILIAGGTNDANNNVSLGDPSLSNCDISTFYGAYHVLLSKIVYRYFALDAGFYAGDGVSYSGITKLSTPNYNVKIILVTPPPYVSSISKMETMYTYGDAVIDVGKRLSFPVANTLANSFVNMYTRDYYPGPEIGGDSYVHLNTYAHKHFAEVIANTLLSIQEIELTDTGNV